MNKTVSLIGPWHGGCNRRQMVIIDSISIKSAATGARVVGVWQSGIGHDGRPGAIKLIGNTRPHEPLALPRLGSRPTT